MKSLAILVSGTYNVLPSLLVFSDKKDDDVKVLHISFMLARSVQHTTSGCLSSDRNFCNFQYHVGTHGRNQVIEILTV